MSTAALSVLRSELAKAEKVVDALKTAIAVIDGDAGAVAPAEKPRRGRKPKAETAVTRKPRVSASKPKKAKTESTGRKARVSAETVQTAILALAANGPVTTRDIESAHPEFNYVGIRREIKKMIEDGTLAQEGDGKRNAKYVATGSAPAVVADEQETVEAVASDPEPEPEAASVAEAEAAIDPSLEESGEQEATEEETVFTDSPGEPSPVEIVFD